MGFAGEKYAAVGASDAWQVDVGLRRLDEDVDRESFADDCAFVVIAWEQAEFTVFAVRSRVREGCEPVTDRTVQGLGETVPAEHYAGESKERLFEFGAAAGEVVCVCLCAVGAGYFAGFFVDAELFVVDVHCITHSKYCP